VQRVGRFALIAFEIAVLSALIIATRCANYQDVFVAGNIYFVDADCYARMTRVQLVSAKPGLIVRHHAFENFPQGTTPHTTAPFDYLILGFSLLLKPFTAHSIDFAGAFISPILALLGGWFLWWWSRRMGFRYGWMMLILYATSPILVHGTELGRPDHQSLLLLLITIGICAQWNLQKLQAVCVSGDAIRESRIPSHVRAWSLTSAAAWALAIWVSAYEPLVLFLILTVTTFLANRKVLFAGDRRLGWILFAVIIAVALLIERRVPSLPIFHSNASFKNWASTIGELAHVSAAHPVWLRWCGYMLLVTPILLWLRVRRRDGAPGHARSATALQAVGRALPVYVLLIATYFLTMWQARWGYFFVLIFALSLPDLLEPIKSRGAVWIAFVLSVFPILRDWDQTLWPNEAELASRVERRFDSMQIRDLAMNLRWSDPRPFLAPWWLSPSIAYWSGQPGVAGSSHEGVNGIEDSARFFLSDDLQKAREILTKHKVAWVVAYDSDRVAPNSSAILGLAVPPRPLCWVLDRTPSNAPRFVVLSAQNGGGKLYRVVDQ
jgi:hypothetical protein